MIRAALAGAACLVASAAGAVECRLALVLAMDVSSSVDAREDALQRGGLAAALTAPEVEAAFFASPLPVALADYEWSGRNQQSLLLDWTLIRAPDDLRRAAAVIGGSMRGHEEFPTAMGYALGYGATLLTRGPGCLFSTIDIAGDGRNNAGFGPEQAYREFPFAGVTVNGLVVNGADFEGEIDLIDFYSREVLHGPGAFLEVAQGFEDYERAMTRKLLRELLNRAVSMAD
ncbi:MAG TPA: hypothetical protein DEA05_09380 [Rhodobacteraceae bacterium]|nr:hypothetical protein [Paracoccaceae bacterium]